ncbi:MAG: tripartite tricarboxylate transporter substrate binding protein [Betaproteobacteria bacterium]|nr:tripartite tricarboxylate transporter substrate binding protein [Betaproteobacteria bacterium]
MLGASLGCGAALAAAQVEYPSKPIRFLVGVVPGGAADMLARAVGQRLAERLNTQVVVDNRPGANQTIAAQLTAQATPDGHTILIVPSAHAISPSIYRLNYDSVRDFSAIGMVAMVPNVLVVHPSIPARSVKDFITFARTKPGELNMGSSGTGSPSHLAGELFQMFTQTRLTHVPFKGQGAAMVDLVAGRLQAGFPSIPASLPHVKAGRMFALGVTPRHRSSAMPDVPTLEEAGVAGYEVNGWYGVLGPARIPKKIVARLNGEIVRMLEDPAMREMLTRAGADPLSSSPEDFSRIIAADIGKWAKVVKAAGVKVQ